MNSINNAEVISNQSNHMFKHITYHYSTNEMKDKMIYMYLGMIPLWDAGSVIPCIVKDFPQPVWPYANIVPLYPSVTPWTSETILYRFDIHCKHISKTNAYHWILENLVPISFLPTSLLSSVGELKLGEYMYIKWKTLLLIKISASK